MIKWLGAIEVERVVFEATGAYHRLFERTLAEARLPVVKIDRCGAAMLARMRCGARQNGVGARPRTHSRCQPVH